MEDQKLPSPVPNSEGPGAPSFVVWKYPGIGATRQGNFLQGLAVGQTLALRSDEVPWCGPDRGSSYPWSQKRNLGHSASDVLFLASSGTHFPIPVDVYIDRIAQKTLLGNPTSLSTKRSCKE